MINAVIGYEGDNITVSVSGHAGFAEKGKDIVCAGVSALVSAFYEAVKDIVEPWSVNILTDKGDGYFSAVFRDFSNHYTLNCVRALVYMLGTGIREIEKQFPYYVNLSVFTSPSEGFRNDTSEQTMNEKREEVTRWN